MTTKRPANPLALAVMGLLLEQPMHPHGIAATLRERELDRAFKVTTGSLYDVVRGLERDGWIVARQTVRVGGRPERTVYAHTPEGRQRFVAWLDELIRVPTREYPKFLSAVSYLGALGRDGAREALSERARRLADEVLKIREQWTAVVDGGQVPRLFMIEVEYAWHLLSAELAWVRQVLADLDNGALTWPAAEARG
jgi:DNA-binding PadR family transcriptional regulator